jgi:hypothetical protein
VDLARGRVRFNPPLQQTIPPSPLTLGSVAVVGPTVIATVNPTARRITTDPRVDTEPVSFADPTFENFDGNPTCPGQPDPSSPRPQLSRHWFVWRRSGTSGANSSTATLWFDTERLGVPLYDTSGNPITNMPSGTSITVIDALTGTSLYAPPTSCSSAVSTSPVEVDYARGIVYFPETYPTSILAPPPSQPNPLSPEGRPITIEINEPGGTAETITDYVHWMHEARNSDVAQGTTNGSGLAVHAPNLAANGQSYISVVPTTESDIGAVPMAKATDEDNPDAFLDPFTYADVAGGAYLPFTSNSLSPSNIDQPHSVWLFWSSSRNASGTPGLPGVTGTGTDIYSEVINPNFQ